MKAPQFCVGFDGNGIRAEGAAIVETMPSLCRAHVDASFGLGQYSELAAQVTASRVPPHCGRVLEMADHN